jgi:hypothetical protein
MKIKINGRIYHEKPEKLYSAAYVLTEGREKSQGYKGSRVSAVSRDRKKGHKAGR